MADSIQIEKPIHVLTQEQLIEMRDELLARGLSKQQAKEKMEALTPEKLAAVYPEHAEALKSFRSAPMDLNPLHFVGNVAHKAGNFMGIPAGFMLSQAYTGGFDEALNSPGFKKYKQSMEDSVNGDWMKSLSGYADALDEGLPRSDYYLNKTTQAAPTGVELPEQFKNYQTPLPSPVDAFASVPKAFRALHKGTEGHPFAQGVVDNLSDVTFDPFSFFNGTDLAKLVKYNPDTMIANGMEKIGKKMHSLPLIPMDTKLDQMGYNRLSDVSYENGVWGTYGQMNKQLKKFADDTTKETKRALGMLSEQKGLTVEPESLREGLYSAAKKTREESGMRPSQNLDSLNSQIDEWTENYPKSQHNDSIVLDHFDQMAERQRKADAFKNKTDFVAGPEGTVPAKDADTSHLFPIPEMQPLSIEEMPLIMNNNRKAHLNDMMRKGEYSDTVNYSAAAESKDNLRRIRDAIQGLEEDAIKKYKPAVGAQIKADNKDLSTVIESIPFMNQAENTAVFDINRPSRMYNWGVSKVMSPIVTGAPQLFKAARESKAGGFVDSGLRRGLFDTLGLLRSEEDKKKYSPEK